MTRLVLVHSPSVGPGTWLPVARRLQSRGVDAVVPDLRRIGIGGPPYWPRVAASVAEAMGQLDGPGSVVLVAHSNAGLFLPTIVDASPRPVDAAILVDAGLPAAAGETAVADQEFLAHLRGLADPDGLLPRWTDWWTDDEVAALVPDPLVRADIVADQPRLPLDYYEQALPVPDSWRAIPGGYLQFTAGYDGPADRARADGWPVAHLPGDHLHQVVDPDGVTEALLDLVSRTCSPGTTRPNPAEG